MKRIGLALILLIALSLFGAWQGQNFPGGAATGWTTNGKVLQMNGTGTVNCASTTFGLQLLSAAASNQGCLYTPAVGGIAVGNRSVSASEQVYMAPTSTEAIRAGSTLRFGWSSSTPDSAANDTWVSRSAVGVTAFGASGTFAGFAPQAVLFANLGTPADGTFAYCSDCTVANPCAGVGSGALAKRLNGAWVCN